MGWRCVKESTRCVFPHDCVNLFLGKLSEEFLRFRRFHDELACFLNRLQIRVNNHALT